eukprot:TRINITY_DN40867_c0_g1_i1.p1 TRINITY_DN40867_c0_g1~~TRINITY_DN40867_c0_g1_i1.p1  ORF type:complete len:327 (+),score=49.28 TRINITY_DN40867_c0_g1_i1:166-1146(+)
MLDFNALEELIESTDKARIARELERDKIVVGGAKEPRAPFGCLGVAAPITPPPTPAVPPPLANEDRNEGDVGVGSVNRTVTDCRVSTSGYSSDNSAGTHGRRSAAVSEADVSAGVNAYHHIGDLLTGDVGAHADGGHLGGSVDADEIIVAASSAAEQGASAREMDCGFILVHVAFSFDDQRWTHDFPVKAGSTVLELKRLMMVTNSDEASWFELWRDSRQLSDDEVIIGGMVYNFVFLGPPKVRVRHALDEQRYVDVSVGTGASVLDLRQAVATSLGEAVESVRIVSRISGAFGFRSLRDGEALDGRRDFTTTCEALRRNSSECTI